jgi:WD40 repeat protein
MTTRHLAPALLTALLVAGLAPAAGPRTDAHGDPLPDGAVARLGTARMRFPAHAGLAFLPPDFKSFLAPDPDFRRTRRYDAATGRPAAGDGFPGRLLAVSADGRRAALAHDRKVVVRELPNGRIVRALDAGDIGAGASLSADGSRLAVGHRPAGGGYEVVVWDVDGNQAAARIKLDFRDQPVVTLAPDGSTVVARPQSGRTYPDNAPAPLRVWDVATGKEGPAITGGWDALPPAVAYAPDGRALAVADGTGGVDVWDVPAGKHLLTVPGLARHDPAVAFAADGRAVLAVGRDGVVQSWGPDGRLVGSAKRPAGAAVGPPLSLGVGADGRVVVWGPRPGWAADPGRHPAVVWAAWEAPAGKLLTPDVPDHGAVTGIAFPPGRAEVWTAGADGRVARWEARTGKYLGPNPGGDRPGRPVGYGPRPDPGHRLAPDAGRGLGGWAGAEAFDPATGDPLFVVPRPPGGPGEYVVLPSADLSLAASQRVSIGPAKPGRCEVWDLADRRVVAGFDLPDAYQGPPPAAGFAADRSRVVLVVTNRDPRNNEHGVVLGGWDLTTGRKAGQVQLPTARVYGIVAVFGGSAVLATPTTLFAADYEGGRVGETIDTLPEVTFGGRWTAPPGAVGPGEAWFAVGVPLGKDGRYGVRVYDWPRGKALKTFTGHAGPITALVVSPDGKTLASGSEDGTAVLWDVADLAPEK